MSTDEQYRGGCLCSAVRYEVGGPALSTNICFCTQCRRQTGSALPAFVTVSKHDLRLLKGEPASFRASPRATRQFCSDCGTPLFWVEDGSDGVDIFLGTLDEPERVRKPDFAIWARHRLFWLPELATVHAYAEARPPGE